MGLREAFQAVMEPIQEAHKAALDSAPGQLLGKLWDGLERPGIQGSAELANALFNGSSYVPYGEGQRAAKESEEPHQTGPKLDEIMRQEPPQQEVQPERGMEMER